MSKKKQKYPQCVGEEKEVPKGFYPVTLYHVTTNIDKVCKEGFKTPDEIFQEQKKTKKQRSLGIGGNSDNKISLTYDQKLAEDYYKDIVTLSNIANGSITPKNICKYLDQYDKNPNMTQKPCELWKSIDKTDDFVVIGLDEGDLQRLKQGKIKSKIFTNTFKILEEMSVDDAVKFGLGKGDMNSRFEKFMELPNEQKEAINNHFLYDKATPKEIQDKLKDWWKNVYLPKRGSVGGRQNPVFFGIDIDTYQKDPSKIGIVKVIGYLPKPLNKYLQYIENKPKWERQDLYDPYYGFPDEEQYKDQFKILTGEKEVRLNPKWYNHLEIIKKGKEKKK